MKKTTVNKSIKKINNYNEKIEHIHRIQTSLFENGFELLKDNHLMWMADSFDALLLSICESIPQNIESIHDNIDYKKYFYEYATDALRKYMNYLCTILSCNTNEYAAKLLFGNFDHGNANLLNLYTSYSNKLSQNVVKNIGNASDKKHEDTFFALPDFTNDVFIEPITNYRNVYGEHNLSAIHIHPLKFEKYSEVLRAITHEVAHHVGQTECLRKLRASLYMKCLFYYIIYNYATIDYDNYNPSYFNCIDSIVEVLKDDAIHYLTQNNPIFNFSNNNDILYEGAGVVYGSVKYYYYTATCFSAIAQYLAYLLRSDEAQINLIVNLRKKLTLSQKENFIKISKTHFFKNTEAPIKNTTSYFKTYETIIESNGGKRSKFSDEFINNCIDSMVLKALQDFSDGISANSRDKKKSSYDEICESIYQVFRECYADMFMLNVTGYSCENVSQSQMIAKIYFNDMLIESNNLNFPDTKESSLRFYVMYKFFGCSQDDTINNASIELKTFFANIDEYESEMSPFQRYHANCTIQYLNEAQKVLNECICDKERGIYFSELKEIFRKLDAGVEIKETLDKIRDLQK